MTSFKELLRQEKDAEIAKANAARADTLSRLPALGLRWLALAPGWTTRIAEAARFPSGGTVKSFFDVVVSHGFASTHEIAPEPTIEPGTGRLRRAPVETGYVMNPSLAREVVFSAPPIPDASVDVGKELSAIASAIQKAHDDGVDVDEPFQKWAELATMAERPAELGATLLRSVDAALTQKTPAFAAAARLIEAAKLLERWLQGSVSEAVHLAGLRYQLRQRQHDAEGYLERYLERDEQMKAFTGLLQAPDQEWALHYVGAGGMGKTMLMRALQTRVGPDRNLSVARIDFDYLEPEYPSTKPALMLLHLAEELRLYDKQGVATSYFDSFRHKVVTFHEGLTAGTPTRPAVELIRDPEFQQLLDTFGAAAQALPPVVLILDTCEELAKMLPDGSVPDNVAAAFEMLEGVHARVPSLRVVFSGRRPLGATGAGGWAARNASHPMPRPYLRLHEVRGFTESEATTYLLDKAKCDPAFVPVILEHCVERTSVSAFEWPNAAPAAVSIEPRYSPYELALYGSWAASDGNLEPQDIKSANLDQYIRTRIIGRISNDAFRRLLPALTWLGRFDHDTVRALTDADQADPERMKLIEDIGRHSWIDRQQGQFLEIDRGLRWRIHEFFRTNHPAELESGRAAAATYFEKLTTSRPVAELDVSHFEAVVRTLEAQPERCATWWHSVEEAVRKSGTYTLLLPITRRLLADDFWPASQSNAPRITAAIAATHAASQLHTRETTGLGQTWRIVEEQSDRHPIAASARRLKLLARAARGDVQGIVAEELDEQTAAAVVGFAERHFDSPAGGEPNASPWPIDQWITVAGLVMDAPLSSSVRAAACLMRARLLAMANRENDARHAYHDAFGWSRLATPSAERWLHWAAPDDLAARIRLELVRWAYPTVASARELAWWCDIPRPATIDADRLAAAVLQLQRSFEPVAVGDMADMRRQSAAINAQVHTPAVAVLRDVPPFYVVAAEEAGELGFIPAALDELLSSRSLLESTANAFGEVIESDRACARLQRKYRLLEASHLVPDAVRTSDVVGDRHLLWALGTLSGDPTYPKVEIDLLVREAAGPEGLHTLWHTMPGIEEDDRHRLAVVGEAIRAAAPSAEPYLEVSCRLDLAEAFHVANPDEGDSLRGRRHGRIDAAAWWREHRTRPVEAFTVWLRAMALDLASGPPPGLVDRVGVRRAAAVALEEGELLALRLPARALRLLRFATNNFKTAGDPMNTLLAEACHALTLARLGGYQHLRTPLDRIRDLFASARASASPNRGRSAPANEFRTTRSWQLIESTVAGSRHMSIADRPTWMHPWLFRIAACVAVHRDAADGGRRCAEVVRAWRRLVPALPREVAGWLDAPQTPAPPSTRGTVLESSQGPTRLRGEVPVGAPPSAMVFHASASRKRAAGSIFETGQVELRGTSGEVLLRFPAPLPAIKYDAMAGVLEGSRQFRSDSIPPMTGPLALNVGHEAAWICWEALFARMPRINPDVVVRRISTLRRLNAPSWTERWHLGEITIHTLTGEHVGADLAGSSWKQARWSYADTPEALLKHLPPGRAQVLHVVGDPIETRAGLRLSLAHEMFQGSSPDERGRLVSADQLCEILPNVQLAVLQCTPLRTSTRSGVHREKLGYLRTFAAELFARIPLVVTVPVLEFRPAVDVLACFGRALAELGSGPPAIVRAILEARGVLPSHGIPDEAKHDLCFYGAEP